jgi:selenocysteine lyase/cysteine desulfurase
LRVVSRYSFPRSCSGFTPRLIINRKKFLRGAALGAAGLVAGDALRGQSPPADTRAPLPAFDGRKAEAFWSAVRPMFPLSRELAYFNTGGLGPSLRSSLRVVLETTQKLQEKSEHGHALFAGAREAVAQFFGAVPAEIAFVRNATEGNAILAAGLALQPGDEVIFESHAHPGGSYCWLHRQKQHGIVVKVFDPDPRDPAGNVARIRALMAPRTRVVQVSHITAPTGIVMPVREIAQLCQERGVWFHVDGAQSAGMIPVALRELGCDSFATSGHKWLGAPLETGVLWVRRERIEEVIPVLVGAYSGEADRLPGELKLAATAERFEYGTRNVALALALAEAMRFQERVGRERIAARGRVLMEQVRSGLGRLAGVEILTPAEPRACASMLTFRTERVPYDRLFSRLMSEHAMRCRPVSEQGLNALRVSTHLFNSPAECDALVAAVDKILRSA